MVFDGVDRSGDNHLDWINVQLFETIFEKELNLNKSQFDIEIKTIKPAVGSGENYLAEVIRVQVEVTEKNVKNTDCVKPYSFIIKSGGSEPNPVIDEWGIFDKELAFYSDIAPILNEMEPSEQYTPKSYSIPIELKEQFKSVVIEDLKPRGFKMLNRLEGLDLEHCKLFYKKLGGYHALTATCYERNGSFAPIFHKSNFGTHTDMIHGSFLRNAFQSYLEIFTKYDYLKPYYENVKNWEHKILGQLQDVTETNYEEFNVLCHGDSWTNNILYLHDENNKPKDLIIVDHQLPMFGTTALDIFYFFITSPTVDVRDNNFDELIQIYHDSLKTNLNKYNYPKKIPTLRELHMELLNKGPIACFLTISMMPLCLVASEESGPIPVALSDTEVGKKIRYNYYNNQRYLKAVESVFKFLGNRGFLV